MSLTSFINEYVAHNFQKCKCQPLLWAIYKPSPSTNANVNHQNEQCKCLPQIKLQQWWTFMVLTHVVDSHIRDTSG